MKKFLMIIPLVILLCFTFSCQKQAEEEKPAVDIDAEKAKVKSVVDMVETAFETEDMEILSKCFSRNPDMIIFGTDAAERWVGWDAFAEAQQQFFEALEECDISTKDLVIKVHKTGEVAWVSWLMDWEGKALGEPFAFKGIRLTGVMEKLDGNWVIVQWHGSVPVSGQAVKY